MNVPAVRGTSSGQPGSELSATTSLTLVGLLLLAGGLWALLEAASRPFWFDEFFTVYLGRLPTLADVWKSVEEVADTNPPTFLLLGRAMRAIIPDDHLAFRLLSILGLMGTVACTYAIVARRGDRLSALLSAAFVLCTPLAAWGILARPYSLMMFCFAMAILAWQGLDRSRLHAVCLALALAAALSLHYYAVLAWPAFVAAEGAVWLYGRRFRLGAWIALTVGFLPLVVLRDHLLHLHRYYGPKFWARPEGLDGFLQHPSWLLFGGHDALATGVTYWGSFFAVASVAALAFRHFEDWRPASSPKPAPALPFEDFVLLAGLLLVPVVAFVVAHLGGAGMTGRYMFPTVLGGAMAVGYLSSWAPRAIRAMLCVLMLANFALTASPIAVTMAQGALLEKKYADVRLFREILADVPTAGLPVVISSVPFYFPVTYYSPPDQTAQIYTLVDPAGSSTDLGLIALRPFAPLRIEEYSRFIDRHLEFILVQTDFVDSWKSKTFKDDHVMTLIAIKPSSLVFRVQKR